MNKRREFDYEWTSNLGMTVQYEKIRVTELFPGDVILSAEEFKRYTKVLAYIDSKLRTSIYTYNNKILDEAKGMLSE